MGVYRNCGGPFWYYTGARRNSKSKFDDLIVGLLPLSVATRPEQRIARSISTRKLRLHPQQSLIPPMTSAEFERFKQDIKTRGIQDALHVTERHVVLDGHHRLRAARELRLKSVPVVIHDGLSAHEQIEFLVKATVSRRNPEPSAVLAAGTHPTVMAAFEKLYEEGKVRRRAGKHLEEHDPQGRRAPQTRDRIGAILGFSGRMIDMALMCWREAPDHMDAIRARESNEVVTRVAAQVRLAKRQREQATVLAKIKKESGTASNIIHGDCLTALTDIPTNSLRLIVTSPPYAEQRKPQYGGVPADKYVAWFMPRAREFQRVIHPKGSLVINIKSHVIDGERHPYVHELVLEMRRQGWRLHEEWIWNKLNAAPGSFEKRFRDGWEYCFQFTLQADITWNPNAVQLPISEGTKKSHKKDLTPGPRYTSTGSLMTLVPNGYWVGRTHCNPSTVLSLSTEAQSRHHPCVFPEELPAFFIKLLSNVGDTVLDPFCGSGTTGAAALKLGRSFVGIETNAGYVKVARGRTGSVKAVPVLLHPRGNKHRLR